MRRLRPLPLRSRLAGGALPLAVLLAAAPLTAQTPEPGSIQQTPEGAPADGAAAADEVVVTGVRRSERASIRTKRDSFSVVDAVSSDDIGRLPDHNTAAALRRIPGVSTQEDQGEPRFPVVRGLTSTYNRTSLNGYVVASVDNNARTVPLDIVPSTLAASLEVVKTITPEMDPNAIGGTVNIATKSAFSERGFFLTNQGGAALYEQHGEIRNEKASWRANLTTGGRFGVDGQFGVVVSGSYQIRDSDIPQVETASPSYRQYTAVGAPVNLNSPTGNGFVVPVQQRLFLYNNVRERTGGALTFEWQPQPSLYLRAFGTYNRMEDDEERNENRLEQTSNVTNQTATTGSFAQARNIVGLGRFQIDRSIWSGAFTARAEPLDGLSWTTDLIYSGAELDNPESTEEFRTAAANAYGFTYDTSDFFYRFNPNSPEALANPANYAFATRSELQRGSREDVYEARSALAYTTDFGGAPAVFKLGGVVRSTKRDADQDLTSLTLPANAGVAYTLADAGGTAPVRVVGGYRFGLRVDSAAANRFTADNRARFAATTSNVTSDYTVDEDIWGGFVQGSVDFGGLTLLGGVRYERTDVETTATRTVNGVNTPADRSGGYDNLLPSLHLKWNAAPRTVLRAAYTNTIGRPDFGSITAREAISFAASGLPTLSRGNPDLRPRRSRGLDASIEYYPTDGLLSLALFHKSIEDEIFTLTTIESLDLGVGRGVEQVSISQARNAESATLFGVEAGIQQALTFLPAPFDGFGVNLNATYVDSDATYQTPAGPRRRGLFLQPEWVANATLYYQTGGFEIRGSYNYIDGFLETINGTIPEADQYWDDRSTVDARASYRVGPRLELFAEAENIFDAGRRELTGPDRDLLQEAADYGRVFWAGGSMRF